MKCRRLFFFWTAWWLALALARGFNFDDLLEEAHVIHDWTTLVRRRLHEIPELGLTVPLTSEVVQGELKRMKVKFSTNWAGGHGVVATIGTGKAPCVALRADMDALPIEETVTVPFRSKHKGAMHACGHDGHMAMLLAATRMLKEREVLLNGTIKLIFQPGEEGFGGAGVMVDEGVLQQEPAIESIFGMHVWPQRETGGAIGSRKGALLAAADEFTITINGSGGHAAMPHETDDPIIVAASLIQALQTIVSRETSPLESAVVSVTSIHAGKAFNVIPDSAVVAGTMRSLTMEGLLRLRDRVTLMAGNFPAIFNCTGSIKTSKRPYPPTLVDGRLWRDFQDILVNQNISTEDMKPTMGGEDFSFFAEKIPGLFVFVGQGYFATFKVFRFACLFLFFFISHRSGTLPRSDFPLHSPYFALDENVLDVGATLHVVWALRQIISLGVEKPTNKRADEL